MQHLDSTGLTEMCLEEVVYGQTEQACEPDRAGAVTDGGRVVAGACWACAKGSEEVEGEDVEDGIEDLDDVKGERSAWLDEDIYFFQ